MAWVRSDTEPDADREPEPAAAPVPRTGVVLAAGRSERLSTLTGGRSKALVRLGGVPLVERSIRTLFRSGVKRVVVVTGHQGDAVAAAISDLDVGPVEVVKAEGWEAGNGASLAAARSAVGDEGLFVLVCGDHMFSEGAMEPLLRSRGPAVLVDRRPTKAAWSEGTRVHVRRGMAIAFSKDLEDAAIDCGAFVLSPAVFDCQEQAAGEGDYSLAGAVTRLARSDGVRVVSLPPRGWWQDVDTPEDLREAGTLLRRSLGKPSDGPVSRHFNRPISTRITMALAPLRIPPNVFTFITLACGLWAAWSLSASRPFVGGLFAQAASILDGVDGETARLQFRQTRTGALFDDFADRAVDAAIVAGLALWIWDDPGRIFRAWIILASAAGLAAIHAVVKGKTASLEVPRTSDRPLGVLLGQRDVRLFVCAGGACAHLPFVAIAAGTVFYFYSVASRVALLWPHRRSSLDAPRVVSPPDDVGQPPDRDLYEVG